MKIELSFDNLGDAPRGFYLTAIAVEKYLESVFTDPITVKINLGWGEANGVHVDSLGYALYFLQSTSYGAIRTALAADHIALPAQDPTHGGNFQMSVAEAQAMGLAPSILNFTAGFVGVNSSAPYTFNTRDGAPVAPGTYDMFGLLEHEITHVLGREMFAGGGAGGDNNFTPMDLFHYQTTRVIGGTGPSIDRSFTPYNGYLSADGGKTLLGGYLNQQPGFDIGGWKNNGERDSFGFFDAGQSEPMTKADLQIMGLLGYEVNYHAMAHFV